MSSSLSAFGLHVGNSSACLAVTRDGRSDVVANPSGSRVTPAAVAWNDREILTGLSALQFASRNPRKVVTKGNKAIMFRKSEDEIVKRLAAQSGRDNAVILVDALNPCYEIEREEKKSRIPPSEIYTHILKYMHEIALSHASSAEDDLNTVLTVPLDYSDSQRDEVAKYAKSAGFNIVQLISEPAAACLAYSLGQLDTSECFNCLIYRVGGTSLTCSVARVNSGFISIIGSVEEEIGGDRITKIVADYLAEEFQRKHKVDPRETKRGLQKLLVNGENIKHILSSLDTANCYIESLYEGIDFSTNVTRARFDNEISKVFTEYLNPIHKVLGQCDLGPDAIEKVVMCGGTSRIPRLQKAIAGIFHSAEMLSSLNPDEVLALGAVSQAGLVEEKWVGNSRPELNGTSYSFVLHLNDSNEEVVIIPSFTPIPVRKSHHLEKVSETISVTIFLKQQSGEKIELAKLHLQELPKDTCKASVSVHIHRDGSAHLALTEKTSGKCDQLTLDSNSHVETVS